MPGSARRKAGLSHLARQFSRTEAALLVSILLPCSSHFSAAPNLCGPIGPKESPDGRQCRVFAEQFGRLHKDAALRLFDTVPQ
jgi:hypothetical protein